MERYYYAIIERSYNFCVLETGYDTHEKAWVMANLIQEDYPEWDIDVLVFNSRKERIEYIRQNSIKGEDYTELYNNSKN